MRMKRTTTLALALLVGAIVISIFQSCETLARSRLCRNHASALPCRHPA